MAKLLLVDSFSLIFRAFYALQRGRPLTATNGEPSGAVFGFANILSSLLEREKPEYIACVFDTKEPTHRHILYSEYKANRQAMPEDLIPQIPRIKELIDALGITRIEQPGFEADDIIGTLAMEGERKDIDVYCVTSDKDYYQLVDSKVRLLKPGSGAEYELHGEEQCREKFGVAPAQVIDVLAIIGDASDNVPGVKGVGEKTAIPLVQQFGTLENIYAHLDEIPRESVRKKFEDAAEIAKLSKVLVTIDRAVPIEHGYEECAWQQPNASRLGEFFDLMGFKTLKVKWMTKLSGDIPATADSSAPSAKTGEATSVAAGDTKATTTPSDIAGEARENEESVFHTILDVPHDYQLVRDPKALASMLKKLAKAKKLAVDLETTSLDAMSCEIVGISLCAEEGSAYYIAVSPAHQADQDFSRDQAIPLLSEEELFGSADSSSDMHNGQLETRYALQQLRDLLESERCEKWGQNIKFDSLILKRHGIDVRPISFDSMIASYILNPDSSHGMDALAERLLHYKPISITELIGIKKATQLSMRDVAVDRVAEYAAEDADVTYKLCSVLSKNLHAEPGLEKLAAEIEFPLITVLRDMEYNGIAVDTKHLSSLGTKVKAETAVLKEKIIAEAGVSFNPDSPKQLGEILFEKLQLPVIKKNKTGYSTDVQVLTELAESYPIASLMLEYRQLQKLQSTYIENLPRMVNSRTGRVHTTYAQHIAATGRLASTDPNLQNIPIKTELGRSIRAAFVAQRKDAVILSADYSQIELRIMAHICGDETLTHAFQNGLDIHTATAARLFSVPLDQVDSAMRRKAKTVNFGIMYGQGAFGLARQLGISRTEGKEIIDTYFKQYERIKNYMEQTIHDCERNGFVQTLCGRRRFLPDITSRNHTIKAAAERTAINTPIQGTAADMIKIAMIRLHAAMKERGFESLMMLQVHDELVFEVLNSELDELRALVKKTMEEALPLGNVPVLVETGVGDNWDEAH